MVRLVSSVPLDMGNFSVPGEVISFDAFEIVFSFGETIGTYRGSFTYGGDGDVFGTIDSYALTRDGTVEMEMTNLAFDAFTFFVEGPDLGETALLGALFAGADVIRGSASADTIFGFGGADDLRGGDAEFCKHYNQHIRYRRRRLDGQ